MRKDSRDNIGAAKVVAFERHGSSMQSKLWALLFCVSALFLIYKGFNWVEAWRSSNAGDKPVGASVNGTPKPNKATELLGGTNVPPNTAPMGRTQPLTNSHNTRTVTKCVLNGSVSYSDGACPSGATNSVVTLDISKVGTVAPQVRLMERQVMTDATPTVVTQQQSAPILNKAPALNFECAALKARIEEIDSITRQPLSIQMQEWYKEERRKVRQRETDLKC